MSKEIMDTVLEKFLFVIFAAAIIVAYSWSKLRNLNVSKLVAQKDYPTLSLTITSEEFENFDAIIVSRFKAKDITDPTIPNLFRVYRILPSLFTFYYCIVFRDHKKCNENTFQLTAQVYSPIPLFPIITKKILRDIQGLFILKSKKIS